MDGGYPDERFGTQEKNRTAREQGSSKLELAQYEALHRGRNLQTRKINPTIVTIAIPTITEKSTQEQSQKDRKSNGNFPVRCVKIALLSYGTTNSSFPVKEMDIQRDASSLLGMYDMYGAYIIKTREDLFLVARISYCNICRVYKLHYSTEDGRCGWIKGKFMGNLALFWVRVSPE